MLFHESESEKLTASSRIWTQAANSVNYDNNRFAKHAVSKAKEADVITILWQ